MSEAELDAEVGAPKRPPRPSRARWYILLGLLLPFTALTYLAVSSGSPGDVRDRPVVLTTLATITGPFVGAIARNGQSCCLGLLAQARGGLRPGPGPRADRPGGAAALAARPAEAVRLVLWTSAGSSGSSAAWSPLGCIDFGLMQKCLSAQEGNPDNGSRAMKNQRLLVALTVINLGLLAYQVVRPRLAFAQEDAPVLRGRALEIVDERGKVRAQLSVFPPDPKHKLPNGDPYPETVLLRLIDPNGRPSVKLAVGRARRRALPRGRRGPDHGPAGGGRGGSPPGAREQGSAGEGHQAMTINPVWSGKEA